MQGCYSKVLVAGCVIALSLWSVFVLIGSFLACSDFVISLVIMGMRLYFQCSAHDC